MPLARSFRTFASILTLFAVSVTAPVRAAEEDPRMQILFVGAAPEAGLDKSLPADAPVIAIGALPEADAVRQEVFAARLRANPVSTFVSTPTETGKQFEQFFLVARATLSANAEGFRLGLGDGDFTPEDFASRLGSAVQAFDPLNRHVGFLHIVDRDDVFPRAVPELQTVLDQLGFDMMVLMVEGAEAAQCTAGQPLHYSVVSGMADRAPFGDADGVSSMAEVETYLSEALSRADSRGCGPAYSLILKSTDDPQHAVVGQPAAPFVEMENRLYHETFEAMFLMESDDIASVQTFLESCVYCPNEAELAGRMKSMEDATRTAMLEQEIWDRIKQDDSRERLAIYVENCVLCAHREEATTMIDLIEAKAAAYSQEQSDFAAAREAGDLSALRAYAESCVACTYREEADALIEQIETDEAYQAERALLAEAVRTRNPARLETYMRSCTVCDGEAEVSQTLAMISKLESMREPCLELAGLPQFEGPRKLEDIDRTRAVAVCEAAAREFPEDGLLRTMIGRIAQAAGNFDEAKAAYAFGMEQEVPAAYGLAAYSFYSPEDGAGVDLDKVEELAAKGAEMGDWLSHEILTVIYSKDLVPGKSGPEAFAVAKAVADQGNPLAEFFVGYYYLTGTGVAQDDDMAAQWLRKAVEQGYTHAYSFLAELHERGVNGIASAEQAADLYWDALQQGDPTATDRLTTQLNNRDREVVRIIQSKLRDAGLYRGPVDGVAGPGTVSAIREYAVSLTRQG
ncbi:MAG: hypothetical protein CMH12_08340 [Maritimibacter sp.]|nr:hypothetical protein [Maritimibacter sp.]